MCLLEVYKNQFRPIYLRGKCQHTQNQYVWSINSMSKFLGRQSTIDDLNDDTISQWLTWLEDSTYRGKKRTAQSINGRLKYIMAFCRWLNRRGALRAIPEVTPLPEVDPTPDAWSEEELKRIAHAASTLPGSFKGIERRAIYTAWVKISWDTGERSSAILQIRGQWVFGNTLHIPAMYRKGRKDATYQLKDSTIEALHNCKFRERERVFYFCMETYLRWYKRILKAARLPYDRRQLNQKLRRTFASHLERGGGDATDAL